MAKIKLRRDTYQNWYDANPVLASGEPAYDTTNNKIKMGNGTAAWRLLPYLTDATGGGGADLGDFKISGSTLGTQGNGGIGWGNYNMYLDPGGESNAYINIPGVTQQTAGNALQIYNKGAAASLVQVFGQGGVQLVTGTGVGEQLLEFTDSGTLNLPYPTSDSFRIRLSSENFVSRPGKATLTLTGDAWDFYGAFTNSQDGERALIADNGPLPSIVNPGYEDGDTFEIDSTAHGIVGYVLTVELSNVVQAGPAGWTANLAFSPPPDYPSTVKSLGAVKLTANTNSLILGTDGSVTASGVLKLTNGIEGSIVGDNGLSIVSQNGNQMSMIYNRATILNPDPAYNANVAALFLDGTGASIEINTDATGNTWRFKTDGTMEYPGGITQGYQDSTQCPAGADTVVYTSTGQFQHAIKLFVMVEGTPTGGTSWETQACDIIAVKGFVNDIVHVTAYGVTYSSATALATFDGQWNATTSRIEITCRPTSLTNNVVASVHAIEMSTND